jgi:hypothetical protein
LLISSPRRISLRSNLISSVIFLCVFQIGVLSKIFFYQNSVRILFLLILTAHAFPVQSSILLAILAVTNDAAHARGPISHFLRPSYVQIHSEHLIKAFVIYVQPSKEDAAELAQTVTFLNLYSVVILSNLGRDTGHLR